MVLGGNVSRRYRDLASLFVVAAGHPRPHPGYFIHREPLKDIGRDCEYFTMMRNPIDRLVSAFYYCPTDHDIQHRPSKVCDVIVVRTEQVRNAEHVCVLTMLLV